MIDLATAHTFLDIAEMTRDPGRARKNVQMAREALDAGECIAAENRGGASCAAIEQSRQQLQHRLSVLERRLAAPFTPGNRCAGYARSVRGTEFPPAEDGTHQASAQA